MTSGSESIPACSEDHVVRERAAAWTRDHSVLAALACAKVAFHFALTGRYGIFRDELYFLACARHLAWGYVDHPPFSIAVLSGVVATLGDSLFAIRLVPVLAGAGVVFLTGLLARELGGLRFAQLLAALAACITPNMLAMSTYFSMNSIEQLIWLIAIFVLVRIVKGGDPRWWIAFGVIAGVGMLNKLGTLVFGASVVLGLVLTPHRRQLASPWLYAGAGVALLIFLPHLLWEIRNDWPFLAFAASASDRAASIPPQQFLINQILTHHPINAPIWLAGALGLGFGRGLRAYRLLGVVFAAVFLVFLIQEGKDYYVTPVYPIAFAAGAVLIERGLDRLGRPRAVKGAVLAIQLGVGVALTPAVIPILEPATYMRYVLWLGLEKPAYLDRDGTPMPQHLADRFGWETMAVAIADVYHALPEAERASTRILCGDWGQAGAVDYFGPKLGLPAAVSPNHSYWYWGPGEGAVGSFVVIGMGDRATLLRYFDEVEERGRARSEYAVQNDEPIFVARGLERPLREVWAEIQRF